MSSIKQLLKQGVDRANAFDYRLNLNKNIDINRIITKAHHTPEIILIQIFMSLLKLPKTSNKPETC